MTQRKSSLVMDLQPGEALEIAGATVHLVHKSGRVARLRISAPVELKIGKRRDSDLADVVPRMAQSGHG